MPNRLEMYAITRALSSDLSQMFETNFKNFDEQVKQGSSSSPPKKWEHPNWMLPQFYRFSRTMA
jgi:hypothetical protein